MHASCNISLLTCAISVILLVAAGKHFQAQRQTLSDVQGVMIQAKYHAQQASIHQQTLYDTTGDTSRKLSMFSSTGDLSRSITSNAAGLGSLHEDCDRHAPSLPLVALAMLSVHSSSRDT